MTEYRFARPGEESELVDLIDLVFSQGKRPHDFEKLLPKVYAHPGFADLHAVAVKDGRLRAAIAMLPVTLCYGDGSLLQAGYVGSVAVHAKCRGEGHMKALMQMQIDRAIARGYDFLALGGQRQRYGYFGFEKGGAALSFELNEANLRHALADADGDSILLRPLTDAEDPALPGIAALHESQPCFCRREPQLLLDTLRSYGAAAYAVEDRATGALLGSLCAQDSRIFELTLTDEELCGPVLRRWGQEHAGFTVAVWDGQAEQAAFLQSVAEDYTLADAEMLRVLNWPRVLSAALRMKHRCHPLCDGRRVIGVGDHVRLCLRVADGEAGVFPTREAPHLQWTEQQAVAALFSPLAALTQQDPLLAAWLPLPLSIPIPDQF